MNSETLYKLLDVDIRLNYNSDAEFARKVGISRQRINQILNSLKKNEKNKKGISINVIFPILEKAGYEITIKKKGE